MKGHRYTHWQQDKRSAYMESWEHFMLDPNVRARNIRLVKMDIILQSSISGLKWQCYTSDFKTQ